MKTKVMKMLDNITIQAIVDRGDEYSSIYRKWLHRGLLHGVASHYKKAIELSFMLEETEIECKKLNLNSWVEQSIYDAQANVYKNMGTKLAINSGTFYYNGKIIMSLEEFSRIIEKNVSSYRTSNYYNLNIYSKKVALNILIKKCRKC